MKHRDARTGRNRRQGLTLVELLIAIGILFLLLSVILVPIRLGFDSLNIGRSRSEVQQAAQATLSQLETDLRKAIYVFPNTKLAGVTDNTSYVDPNYKGFPYVLSMDADINVWHGPCDVIDGGTHTFPKPVAVRFGNTARIDILVPQTSQGTVVNPIRPANYIVTYYPRRLDNTAPYDEIDNPVVLFRAQMPYRKPDGSAFHDDDDSSKALNAVVDARRMPAPTDTACSDPKTDQQARWICHNSAREADLAPMCDKDAEATGQPTVFASHQLATPRGMALEAPGAKPANPSDLPNFQPNSSFSCVDTNKDGKIDRVNISLILANYQASNETLPNGAPKGQVMRFNRTVDIPNIR